MQASFAAPPLWRVLWWLGLEVPPPHFLRFWALTLLTGTLFGVAMWVCGWVAAPRFAVTPPLLVLTAAAGIVFGLIVAMVYRASARGLGLPSWNGYLDHSQLSETFD